MPNLSSDETTSTRQWLQPSLLKIYGALLLFFVVAGAWLASDVRQGYKKVLTDTAQLATQRSQIISQSFRSQVLASDYVLRDVLGRIKESDLVYPDPDSSHAGRMTQLLKEKSATVSDFSMVLFNRDCVFTATISGANTGVRSSRNLCEARKMHSGPGPLVGYVSGLKSASGQSVIVLSRNLMSPGGNFLGGVLGVIELVSAQHWFDSLGLDMSDSVALLDDAKVLLARHPLLPQAIEKPATALEIPDITRASAPGGSVPTQRDLDDRERIFGFSRIDGFPFIVAFGFDKAEALEEWQRRAVELTAAYFSLLLLAFAVARSQWTTLRQREELRSSEEHFRMLAENMVDIVWKVDTTMRFTYINGADQKARGFPREEVVGTYLRDNLTPQGKDILQDKLHDRLALEMSAQKGIALKYDLPMRHRNGGEVWMEMSSVPIYASDGNIAGYQGVGRDVSGRRQHEANLLQSQQQLEDRLLTVAEEKSALQELATRDALTGLYNRRFLDAALPREFARSERDKKQLAVIMLDLDHFKAVNDDYGHAAGDEVLVTLAELLKKGARESDLICRYGGEEFVAIMPSMSAEHALERVESWRIQLEETRVVYADCRIGVTLSAGIAIFPDHGDRPGLLLACADEMLYKSKQTGRNRISIYSLD